MPLNTTLPSLSQAHSLLTPAASDQSVGILNTLFGVPGGKWESLYYQAIGGSGSGSLFFTLLKDFDTVVLAWVVITIVITGGIGAMSTAHEGKALGQRYHTLWTPVRSAMAMVLLAPIPGVGLSLIQGLVLMMVGMSVGGANYLATQATSYMSKNGGQITSVAPGGGQVLSKEILQSELAQQYLVNYESSSPPNLPIYQVGQWHPASNGIAGHYNLTFSVLNGLKSGQLGMIQIQCQSQNGVMCKARLSSIKSMAQSEYHYVQKLVNATQAKSGSTTLSTTNSAATAAPQITNATVYKAGVSYDTSVAGAEQQIISQSHPALMQSMDNLNSDVSHLGWMSLGMYYWRLAGVNEGIQARVSAAPRWIGYNQKAINSSLSSGDRVSFHKLLNNAGADLQVASRAAGSQSVGMTALDKVFSSQGAWYADAPIYTLMQGNILTNLQTSGDVLVNSAIPAAVGTYALMRSVSGGAKGESEGASIFGEGTTWLAAGANSGIKALEPMVYGIILALFVVGMVWAYYLPSVPFIVWIMGIVSWLIFIVEALVGSVLWVAGIALPEGEGLIGPRGDQGVMLFIDVMFRPALMVIGFFAAFELIDSMGNVVGAAFSVFMGGMYSTGGNSVKSVVMAASPITWIATAILASGICVVLVHKIFGMITLIPDKVLRWVGGQGAQLGGGSDVAKTQTAFVGAVGVGRDSVKAAMPVKNGKGLVADGETAVGSDGVVAVGAGPKAPKAGTGSQDMVAGGGAKTEDETPPPKE